MNGFVDLLITDIAKVSREGVLAMLCKELEKASVYVGIPEENTQRFEGKGKKKKPVSGINNAALLYLHSNGSPLQNIPARPVLEPAIENGKDKINQSLFNAGRAALNNDKEGYMRGLERTGLMAQNMCKKWFTDPDNGWAPNQPSTVLHKINKLKGKKKVVALLAFEAGEDLDRPLIDTGQLRQAITYLVKENE